MNILLVEPDYRSKFPPLGLMRIAAYHREQGDEVAFVRGKDPRMQRLHWNRIYVSSLFTYELPRTVDTLIFYADSVASPDNLVVGGIGATLMPDYIRDSVRCVVVTGPLDQPDKLCQGAPAIAGAVPDYSILDGQEYEYQPQDAYFCRVTTGCIRKCKFCAVPVLEPKFGYLASVSGQISAIKERYGVKRDLVLMDNNILAIKRLPEVVAEIRDAGFAKGAKLENRNRCVDFNQGIDARLITPAIARLLSSIAVSPVRLAFDADEVEPDYRRAIKTMADEGFSSFTNYVLFNYADTPQSLYHRLAVNLELSVQHRIRITGFPMKFVPIDDVKRQHIAEKWHWRYLRGIQCILNATHGMVSPNPPFFERAFGRSAEEFVEIVSMPDRYIMDRERHEQNGEAANWRSLYGALAQSEHDEFMRILYDLRLARDKKKAARPYRKRYGDLLEHYYPGMFSTDRQVQLRYSDDLDDVVYEDQPGEAPQSDQSA